jgi:hypothetical protein
MVLGGMSPPVFFVLGVDRHDPLFRQFKTCSLTRLLASAQLRSFGLDD